MVRTTCRTLALLPLVLFAPAVPAPAAPQGSTYALGPVTVRTDPLTYETTLKDGVTGSGKAYALGGTGDVRAGYGLGGRHLHLTLREVDADQLAAALFADLPAVVRDKVKGGKVGLVTLDVSGGALQFEARGFRVPGDPVTRVTATADLKAKTYKAKVFCLGGLVEVEGKFLAEE